MSAEMVQLLNGIRRGLLALKSLLARMEDRRVPSRPSGLRAFPSAQYNY